MIESLVECLAAGPPTLQGRGERLQTNIMVRLEEILRIHPDRLPSQTELSAQLGVNARTLRVYCGHHLGVAPGRYVRLRRLGRIRRALQDANPGVTIISALERHHGVNQLGRFAGDYRHLFGELPSETLRQSRGNQPVRPGVRAQPRGRVSNDL